MGERRPRVLVLTFTPINREPRAVKQARYFSNRYDVTTAGLGAAPVSGVPHISLTQESPHSGSVFSRLRYIFLLTFRFYALVHRLGLRDQAAFELLAGQDWDVVIANDILTIPLANRLGPRHGVLADLHEYAPRQNEHSLAWRILIAPYFRWICRTHVRRAAAVTTVSAGIVTEYKRQFGIDAQLVINATPFEELNPASVSSPLRLVHSGIPAPARKLEIMIEAVRDTIADVTLDLYLMDDSSSYLEELRVLAAATDRVQFQEPVPYRDLIRTLNQYDVGLSIIAPTTFNLAWCLPNKFFDFIQARLGVIIGPSPEMTRFVDQYEIGAVTDDFTADSFVRLLESLTPERVEAWKRQAHVHATALSSEEQVKVWGEIVERMLADR